MLNKFAKADFTAYPWHVTLKADKYNYFFRPLFSTCQIQKFFYLWFSGTATATARFEKYE